MPNIQIIDLENGYQQINITFNAEELTDGETLAGTTIIKGTSEQANDYAGVFEADLRHQFADKFPVPEIPVNGDMLEGE